MAKLIIFLQMVKLGLIRTTVNMTFSTTLDKVSDCSLRRCRRTQWDPWKNGILRSKLAQWKKTKNAWWYLNMSTPDYRRQFLDTLSYKRAPIMLLTSKFWHTYLWSFLQTELVSSHFTFLNWCFLSIFSAFDTIHYNAVEVWLTSDIDICRNRTHSLPGHGLHKIVFSGVL